MRLPKKFLDKMEQLLGEEFKDFLNSYEEEVQAGLRINTLKINPKKFETICPFKIEPIPWVSNGYYFSTEEQPAKHPYYYVGLYYIQEPSAMIPASLLPIQPGDKVLDLCAAPGGKTTELAAKLGRQGVLITNDISNKRAKALLKNVELEGIPNAIVMNESPEKMAKNFKGYFDKILIDAPCSGEGMFRKDPSMIHDYEEHGVDYYCRIQKNIVSIAAQMLKPGGMLLYSTCTFSPEENEGVIQSLLEEQKEFSVVPIKHQYGFSHGRPEWVNGEDSLRGTVRIWPHKVKGEGHFAALLQKYQGELEIVQGHKPFHVELSKETEEFLSKLTIPIHRQDLECHEDRIYQLPEGTASLKGLHILQSGLYLGDSKKNRFEPSQALANVLGVNDYKETIILPLKDGRVIKYLKGETIEIEDEKKTGWQLVCVDGFPLGWGKADRGRLKNKYYAGWRWM